MEPNNNNDNIRPPDNVFCEKLIDDDDDSNDIYQQPYNKLPKLKRHMTNTWYIQKTDDNRFISVPVFKDEDEDESEDVTSLYNSILNNSDNNDNITIDDYDLEKAIQESLNQYNLENKNTLLPLIQSDEEHNEKEKTIQESLNQYNLENKNTLLPLIHSDEEHNEKESKSEFEHQTQITEIDLKKKNLLPIFKSKMHRLIFFDKEFKEIYELIKPIIDLYETSDLNYHETDNVTYDKIFNTLRSLRIPKEEWNILKTIFVKKINYTDQKEK